MQYSITKLYENGMKQKENFMISLEGDFKANIRKEIHKLYGERFYDYRNVELSGIKALILCVPEGFVYSVLYFSEGKFAFELKRGLYSPLDENLFKESYFKISDKFCEGDLADYKDVLLNVESFDVDTAMVKLRKCNCFGCNEVDIPRIRVDISMLEPAEGIDHRFLMDFEGSAEKRRIESTVAEYMEDSVVVRRRKLEVVK